MARSWFRPGALILGSLALVLVLAVACGTTDPTPQPTPTPVDVAAIVQQALAGQPAGVTVDQVASEIAKALAAQPGVTAADTAKAIETALAAKPGVTSEQVAAAITKALGAQPGISPEDIQKTVQEAVAKALPTAMPAPAGMPSAMFVREGKRGGVIPMVMNRNPRSWSIWGCSSSSSCVYHNSQMHNGLMEFNAETLDLLDVRGDLAREWGVAADSQTYTFRLFDAQWWDGTKVTAEDVVYSLDKIADPDLPHPSAGFLGSVYEPGNARAIDGSTVEVRTKVPTSIFLPLLANHVMKMQPKHHLERGLDILSLENVGNVLGSGPWKVREFKKDISLQYIRNDNYFKAPRPYFDGMMWFLMNDASTIIAAFKTEQVLACNGAACGLNTAQYKKLGEDMGEKGTFFPVPSAAGRILVFNTQKAPFSDPRVRKAINLALYRQEYLKIAGSGLIGAPFLPDSWFYLSSEEQSKVPGYRELNGEKHPDDLAEAKKLLADAGFPNGFKSVVNVGDISAFTEVAEVVSAQLKRYLNIDAPVKVVDFTAGLAQWRSGDFEMLPYTSSPLVVDPDVYNTANNLPGGSRASRFHGWEDPRVVDLADRISKGSTQKERRALTLELGKILEDESPYIVMGYPTSGRIGNNKIKNYHPPIASEASAYHEHTWLEDNYIVIGQR